MKISKYLFRLIFIPIFIIIFIDGCGGAIGNIETTLFYADKKIINKCIGDLKTKNIWFDSPDSTMYKSDDYSLMLLIKDRQDTLVFGYRLTSVKDKQGESLLILFLYGKYGDVASFNSDLSLTERNRCKKIFNEQIISNISTLYGIKYDLDVWQSR